MIEPEFNGGRLLRTGPLNHRTDGLPILIIFAVAALLIAKPLVSIAMTHDSFWIDYVWAKQFSAQIAAGNLYPRWLPDSFSGLGAPVFYFYPPLGFVVIGVFDWLGASTYDSILLAFGLSFFLSGIGAYVLFRRWGIRPLLGATIYMLAPYHLSDFYVRGALAESVAIAVLPFLLLGLSRIARGEGWRFGAVCYALLIVAHLPLALLASVFLIAPFAVAYRNRLMWIAALVAGGVGLAAIYLIPALTLGPFRDEAQLYIEHRLNPAHWGLWSAQWDDPFVLLANLLVASIAIPAALLVIKFRDPLLIYCLAICAMAVALVPFVWSLPLLAKVQFPFRMMPLAEIALAAFIAKTKLKTWQIAIALFPTLFTSLLVPNLPIDRPATLASLDKIMPDVAEFLPPGTIDYDLELDQYPDFRAGRVPVPDRGTAVRLEPVFYFPIWSCGWRDEQTKLLAHRPDCSPRMVGHPSETWGALVSVLTAVLLGLAALPSVLARSKALPRMRRVGRFVATPAATTTEE